MNLLFFLTPKCDVCVLEKDFTLRQAIEKLRVSGRAAVPVIDDGTWTCENGHAGNTGKFCSECGAKKPE